MRVTSQSTRFLLGELPILGNLRWRGALIAGGIAAFGLYVGMDAFSALRFHGYSYVDQTISELSAVGAPTRSLWEVLGLVYAVLIIGCGAGVWLAAGSRRGLRVVAVAVMFIGLLGLVAWPFAPMHQRAVLAAGGGTFQDTMHLVLSAADTVLFIVAIAFGARAFGRRFRAYSLTTIAIVLLFGAYNALMAGRVGQDESTPGIGIAERIAVFGSMLWIAVLSFGLLRDIWQRRQKDAESNEKQAPRAEVR